jgi:hypothetical protein
MYPPSQREEEIVGSAWRHAESGRNGLAPLCLGISLDNPKFLNEVPEDIMFFESVLLAHTVSEGEVTLHNLDLGTLLARHQASRKNMTDFSDLLLGDDFPFKVSALVTRRSNRRLESEDMSAKSLFHSQAHVFVIISKTDADLRANQQGAAGARSIGDKGDTSFPPEEPAKLCIPQFVHGDIVSQLLYDVKRDNRSNSLYDLEGDSNISRLQWAA